jgi:DNA-binding XRE family transcriptional regulator
MNTFSTAFRAEVVRIARKELKPELQSMRKAITGHRSEIAALRREVKALASQLKATQRLTKVPNTPKAQAATNAPKAAAISDFNAQAFADKRTELGITQKQMAQLVGASWLSVYKWESGQVHPRAAQMDRISKVLKLSKRKALALLSQD